MEVAKNKKPPVAGANAGGQIKNSNLKQALDALGYCRVCRMWLWNQGQVPIAELRKQHNATEAHLLNALSS